MTENEARKKWCPMVRVTVTPNDATWQGNMLTNRGQVPAANTDTLCIASDCMMWKWKMYGPDDQARLPESMQTGDEPEGYCGLTK